MSRGSVLERLIIIGARGLGRELLAQLRGDPANNLYWRIGGFLDTAGSSVLCDGLDMPVIGSPFTYEPLADDIFISAIGDPRSKREYTSPLVEKGARFVDIRTNVSLGERSSWGPGTVFGLETMISADCTIGSFVHIDCRAIIGHDVKIGDYCHIGAMVFIGGGVTIGKCTSVNPLASIAKGVTIGDGAVVGMGAVVLRDVPSDTLVVGNPARNIGKAP